MVGYGEVQLPLRNSTERPASAQSKPIVDIARLAQTTPLTDEHLPSRGGARPFKGKPLKIPCEDTAQPERFLPCAEPRAVESFTAPLSLPRTGEAKGSPFANPNRVDSLTRRLVRAQRGGSPALWKHPHVPALPRVAYGQPLSLKPPHETSRPPPIGIFRSRCENAERLARDVSLSLIHQG